MSGYDVAVVGSGFGGAVMAYRLAERGYSVVILERGREWTPDKYPRDLNDDWIFDPEEPAHQHGWLDLRLFDDMAVAQGAGLGGGSLIYANILVDAPAAMFRRGWPAGLDYQELQPYYRKVEAMLEPSSIPDNQLTERFKLMREGAQQLGYGNRFEKLPLAVRFDNDWHYGLEDPFNPKWSKSTKNVFGKTQGTCIHLGNCDIGCDVQARNTLDLNYLAGAQKFDADIKVLHLVRSLELVDDGYRVNFERIDEERKTLIPGSLNARHVVLSAGSIGSTELLLRCRDQYKTLPKLSRTLGKGWSANGDFVTPAFYGSRKINATQGPTISSSIDFLDGVAEGQSFFIEDGGFPDVINNYLSARHKRFVWSWRYRKTLRDIRRLRKKHPLFDNVMPWFAQGIDAANGRLYLGRRWYSPWKKSLKMDWDVRRSTALIEAIIHMHKRLATATGAESVWVPPTWSLFKNLVTPHPLGGCNMGVDRDNGVVDQYGRVFGYPNLYVVDGAMLPEAIGKNPSKTIAALAERCAEHFERWPEATND